MLPDGNYVDKYKPVMQIRLNPTQGEAQYNTVNAQNQQMPHKNQHTLNCTSANTIVPDDRYKPTKFYVKWNQKNTSQTQMRRSYH